MTDLSITRHQEIFNPAKDGEPVTLIGAGAVGSRVFAALAELGLTDITVYDFDKVEAHNLANQMYFNEHIGKYKVDALKDWYTRKIGYEPPDGMEFINKKLTPEEPGAFSETDRFHGTVFLMVDTMEARRELADSLLKNNTGVTNIIDTRMAATHGDVFIFNANNPIAYENWVNTLIDDDDAELSACGSPFSVGTTASLIANIAVWQMKMTLIDPVAAADHTKAFFKPMVLTTENLA